MIIQTADHVSDAIQFLTLEQRAAVYASIKSHLINLISSNHDLNLVLKKLLPEEKKELIGLVSSSHRFFGKALVLQAPITERKILQKL